MTRSGRAERVLVVYPQVAEAITAYRAQRNLPQVEIEELKYGLDEVMQIVNLLGAELLTGARATIHGFLDMLAEPWDVIWLITHGEEAGWFLADGLVNAAETTQLVRSSGAFLFVMNTCSSIEVASKVSRELGIALISTITQVPDRQALITGVLFARHLAAGLDYIAAYDLAAPGQAHPYVLLRARVPMLPPNERGKYQKEDQDGSAIHRFVSTVEELQRVVYGSPMLGLPPLREVTTRLEQELVAVKNDLSDIKVSLGQIQKNQTDRNRIMGALVIVITALIVSVALVAMRGVGGV